MGHIRTDPEHIICFWQQQQKKQSKLNLRTIMQQTLGEIYHESQQTVISYKSSGFGNTFFLLYGIKQSWYQLNKSMFYFMSLHSRVILDMWSQYGFRNVAREDEGTVCNRGLTAFPVNSVADTTTNCSSTYPWCYRGFIEVLLSVSKGLCIYKTGFVWWLPL